MKTTFRLLLMSFLFMGISFAQQRECSTMENLEYRKQLDPGLQKRMNDIEKFTQKKINEMSAKSISGDVITIPVVVHVIYSNSNENISDAQILSQIQVLNDDFRRLNSDADNTWSQATDTQIEFCMASVDPNGNSTNGITRKSSSRTSWGTNDAMKSSSQGGVSPWDTSQYLNMWVCNIGGGILGYAQFPGGSAATDGVVMSPQYFGSSAGGSGFYLSAPFDLGRTTTHEVGHYLNLRHIWGDGGCSVDDFVSDTPTSDGANYGCSIGHVSCGTTDMVQNYMDYSDDSCMNLFTQGQKDRMRAILAPGGVRRSLALSDKCNGGGTTPSCSDGIQNGDETGVDCGGSCAPCQVACTENPVNISITLDNYPEETAWTVTNSGGQTVASGGTYGSQPDGSTITEDLCLPDGCYTFTITDAYGDGICCSYGNGSYSVTDASGVVASGGSFGSSESTEFCLGSTPEPTCSDGIQNGDETGVDCGGSCTPCSTGGTDVLHQGYFETGWDGWSDGGSDCDRYSGSRSYEGSYSIRIRDNSGTASAMTSPSFNLTSYNQVEVEFYFYSYSMESGEDFWLRFYNGSSWTTVASYASGTNFNNNTFYTATVTLDASQYNFASNSQFRFQCDASANADHIYIDQVTITGIGGGTRATEDSIKPLRTLNEEPMDSEYDFLMYPNPVKGGTLYIKTFSDNTVSYKVINMLGQTVSSGKASTEIDVATLKAGMYFLEVNDGEDIMTRKFIKE
ncbi:M43 family zinc metalloprotease [Winogradskyella sp. SYSU M77433]|uniref:M43 family zinc metalloprotease n=1 Tax=Winogradskyella sp. SYSU M77433 TaxID=3042722 RepID=UPI0024810074|nr:M43 family zinc metalloprotease [Winogradskyella sp. SYSU M77433]MDH7913648.1 M43 family zinc metalloprotease [Winogradskyella sp. SYSU M77433]